MMSFNNLRVLVFMLDKRARYRQRMFSNVEVFCGPDCDTYKIGDTFISIKTPVGMFDIQGIINQLPSHQQPDLIVVKADSSNRNYPVNLQSINCPKVLICEGTQNIFPPIRPLMLYAKQENFDFICSENNRQHLHFFKDAGFNNVFWTPALNLNPANQPFRLTRNSEVFLVNNIGRNHPYRHSLVNQLRQNSIPVNVNRSGQEDAAEMYSKSVISLNCSLNGELNRKIFEIISSGGFLLTDALSKDSGLYDLFTEEEHFRHFNSASELVDLCEYYLENPREAQNVATAALNRYQEILTPEKSLKNFYTYIFDGQLDEMFKIESRINFPITFTENGLKRVERYEECQDLQLSNKHLDIAFSNKVYNRIYNDIKDLNKISIHKTSDVGLAVDLLVIDEKELGTFDAEKHFDDQPFRELKILTSGNRINSSDSKTTLKVSSLNPMHWELKNLDKCIEKLCPELLEKFMVLRAEKECNKDFLLQLSEKLLKSGRREKAVFYAGQVVKSDRASMQALIVLARCGTENPDLKLIKDKWNFTVSASRSPLKILLITNLFPPQEFGGYGRLMADFSTVLKAMGHDVYVLTTNSTQFGDCPVNEPGIFRSLNLTGGWKDGKTYLLPQTRAHKIEEKNLSTLRTHIRAFNPDVCLMGNIDCLGLSLLFEILNHQIPVVHHLGGASPGYQPVNQPKTPLYRYGCASQWVQNALKKRGFDTSRSSVIYPGAAVDFFNFNTRPVFDKLRIAFAGIVQPYKGAHLLINSLAALRNEGYDFTCEIAGTTTDAVYLDQLKQFVLSQSLADRITFSGFMNRQEIRKLFGRTNTLVFPTIVDEAFGISQAEAMAAGLCVVSSGTGGASEIIKDGNNGFIFDKENNNSLTASLKTLVDDRGLAKSMAMQGHKDVFEKFNIVQSTEKLVKELESLAALREPLILK